MKKIAVVYVSKYGHTKKYADWLKESVEDVDVIAVSSFNFTRMLEYKLVIFACGVYGDKMAIMDNIKKNIVSIPLQKTMVMAVGWYVNDSEEAKERLIAENYPEQFKGTVPMYIVNSGLADKKQLSVGDKAALMVAQRAIDKKAGRSSDDINALAIIKGYSDQTSKDNLASIIKGIDEFFNPPAKPEPAAKPAAKAPAAPAPKPAAPAPAPAKPRSAADQLGDSVEEAFKNLKAPKPAPQKAPEPEPIPAAAVAAEPTPETAPEPEISEPSAPVVRFNSKGEVVVSSVVAAINSLNNDDLMGANQAPNPIAEIMAAAEEAAAAVEQKSKPAPKPAPAPAPAPKPAPAPIATEDDINSSLEAAFKNLHTPKAAPAPAPAPAAEAAPETAAAKEIIPEPAVQEVVPEPVPEPAPAPAAVAAESAPEPTPRKNSYMEMFAKRRRTAEAEPAPAPPAPAPEPAPAAPTAPARSAYEAFTQPQMDFDMGGPDIEEPAAAPAPEEPASIGDFDMEEDVYDFLDESAHVGSKRALTAVQDLAKAKAQAEKEAARLAAAKHAEMVEEEDEPEEYTEVQTSAPSPVVAAESVPRTAPAAPAPAPAPAATTTAQQNEAIEKMRHDIEMMRHDIEALAEESEHVTLSSQESAYAEQTEYTAPQPQTQEEESDGLEAFAFTDSADYDLEAEFSAPEPEPIEADHRSKADLDIMKLQEEINASIESNRAAKEKMMARQNRHKEEAHNPFKVQFDDEEDEKKKKPEPKRLADPIDPDIFFSRTSTKGKNVAPGVMPEIKFRN